MKLWREGDRSRGVCERCKRLVDTRFERRPVTLARPAVVVPDVLVAACETCGETVAVPAQSAPRLREARRRDGIRVNVRIPLALDDALHVIASKYDARPDPFEGSVIRYYLSKLAEDDRAARRLKALAGSGLASGPSTGRLSIRLERPAWDAAWERAKRLGMKKSDVIRGAIMAAAVDAGVATEAGRRPSAEGAKALRTIARATAVG